MAKVSAVVLAVIVTVGLVFAAIGLPLARGETAYTVPQVLASLPALQGHTVLVRAFCCAADFGQPFRPLTHSCQKNCISVFNLGGARIYHGSVYQIPALPVTEGPQDPILVVLRAANLLPPFPAQGAEGTLRVYRVRVEAGAPRSCGWHGCPIGVLLDGLR